MSWKGIFFTRKVNIIHQKYIWVMKKMTDSAFVWIIFR